MKEKLAINGGEKVFTETPQVPVWPVVSEETAEKLKKVYLSGNGRSTARKNKNLLKILLSITMLNMEL